VFQNPLTRLKGLTQPTSQTAIWIVSVCFAVSGALLLVLFGWYCEFLSQLRSGELSTAIPLGPYLAIDPTWLEADRSALRGTIAFLCLMLLCVVATASCYVAIAKLASGIASDESMRHVQAVYQQLSSLVRRRSPSLLKPTIDELTTTHVPAIRDANGVWLSKGPLYLCLAIVSTIVAMLIDPWLAALSVLAAIATYQVAAWFDRKRRRSQPVVSEQRSTSLKRLSNWLCQVPFLETFDPKHVGVSEFEHELSLLRPIDRGIDEKQTWKSPLVYLLTGAFVLLILFAASVRILSKGQSLNVVSFMTLLIIIAIAIFSFRRFMLASDRLKQVTANVQSLHSFLSRSIATVEVDSRIKLPTSITSIELKDVTLHGPTDAATLEGISASLHPGEIVAIAADEVSQCALADFLLGFGYPSKGELFVNGIPLRKLGVERLGELTCWVASDGPIFAASVTDNLRTIKNAQVESTDLTKVLQRARCESAISNLQDGLATLVSANDDRFGRDIAFRLGLARAMTLMKPIVVIDEPESFGDAQMEQASREAIEQVAASNLITIVLPARPRTLWAAHQVIFIQDGRLVAIGKHATLLEQNDAYRHWNYMRFSPYLANGKTSRNILKY
jgi:ATP-binding cassette, subfamily B, bacterial